MATGQRTPRGSRRGAEALPAKAAKTTKATTVKKTARKPTGAVMPYLTVRDAAASLAFYEQAFGFKRGEAVSAPDGRLIRVVMHHAGAAAFRFSPEGIWSGSMQAPATSDSENSIVLYVPCRKVDDLTARARAAGATILSEPEDMFWGERIVRIVDPDGYVWCFAASIHKFDPSKLPQVAQAIEAPEFDLGDRQSPATEQQQDQGSDLDFEL